MNTEETKQAIKVMQAFVEGEKVECKSKNAPDIWFTIDSDPKWNFLNAEYRIKPDE